MEAYTGFAALYDAFMEDTPYDEWKEFLIRKLKENGIEDGLVLDLGCGTGTLTEAMAAEGYDMIGVDMSEDMLQVALEKREASGADILYLCQDMREFELYGTVRAVVSVCDSVNYITEPEELKEVFRLVNNYLDPKGVFVFDFNTVYKYEILIGDSVIAENREDCSFIWENFYYPEEQMNEYEVTFFQKEGELYRKFTENHFQRGYTLDEIKRLLAEAGLVFHEARDGNDFGPVTPESGRIFVIAGEQGK
ncbi:MAG: methyltransferase domain-containing protein [Lachnospiraceae bacterium]|nr:methyltransferase domain-containing protein [Lachnospiraceae bacterium]